MRLRDVLFQKSSLAHTIDANEQRLIAGCAQERCPIPRPQLWSVVYALCRLVQVELLTVIAPQFVWSASPGGSLVLVTQKANIGQNQACFTQDCIKHNRHELQPPARRSMHLKGPSYRLCSSTFILIQPASDNRADSLRFSGTCQRPKEPSKAAQALGQKTRSPSPSPRPACGAREPSKPLTHTITERLKTVVPLTYRVGSSLDLPRQSLDSPGFSRVL